MSVADNVKKLAIEATPVLEQWIEIGEVLAGFRDAAKEHGIDWSKLKAVLVAKIKDNRDGGTRLADMTEKAAAAQFYADIVAKNNFSPPQFKTAVGGVAPSSSGEPVPPPAATCLQGTGSPNPIGDTSLRSRDAPQSSPVAATARPVAGPSIPDDLSIPQFMRRNLINV